MRSLKNGIITINVRLLALNYGERPIKDKLKLNQQEHSLLILFALIRTGKFVNILLSHISKGRDIPDNIMN